MRHGIAHDGIPAFALLLKSSGFAFKARYVNDIHLPRFGLPAPVAETATVRTDLIRNSHPQPDAPRAIQRISHRASALLRKLGFASADSPQTVGMIAQWRFCVNRRARPNWREVSDTPRQNANSAPAANPVRNHISTEMSIRHSAHCRGDASNWQSHI